MVEPPLPPLYTPRKCRSIYRFGRRDRFDRSSRPHIHYRFDILLLCCSDRSVFDRQYTHLDIALHIDRHRIFHRNCIRDACPRSRSLVRQSRRSGLRCSYSVSLQSSMLRLGKQQTDSPGLPDRAYRVDSIQPGKSQGSRLLVSGRFEILTHLRRQFDQFGRRPGKDLPAGKHLQYKFLPAGMPRRDSSIHCRCTFEQPLHLRRESDLPYRVRGIRNCQSDSSIHLDMARVQPRHHSHYLYPHSVGSHYLHRPLRPMCIHLHNLLDNGLVCMCQLNIARAEPNDHWHRRVVQVLVQYIAFLRSNILGQRYPYLGGAVGGAAHRRTSPCCILRK